MTRRKFPLGALFLYGALAFAVVATVFHIESQTVSRESIALKGETHQVRVMRNQSISVGNSNVRIKDGRFVTRVTRRLPRGMGDYDYSRASTPEEIALYRAAFPS